MITLISMIHCLHVRLCPDLKLAVASEFEWCMTHHVGCHVSMIAFDVLASSVHKFTDLNNHPSSWQLCHHLSTMLLFTCWLNSGLIVQLYMHIISQLVKLNQ